LEYIEYFDEDDLPRKLLNRRRNVLDKYDQWSRYLSIELLWPVIKHKVDKVKATKTKKIHPIKLIQDATLVQTQLRVQWARAFWGWIHGRGVLSLQDSCKPEEEELQKRESNRSLWVSCRLWQSVWELSHQLGDLREFIQKWSYTIDHRNFRDPLQRLLSRPTVEVRKEWANTCWGGMYQTKQQRNTNRMAQDAGLKRLYSEHARDESRTGFHYFFIQPLLVVIFYVLALVGRLFCDPRSFGSEFEIVMRAPAQALSYLHSSLFGLLQPKGYVDEFGTYHGEKFELGWTDIYKMVHMLRVQQSARGGMISAVFALLWKRKYFALMRILGIISLHYFDIVTDFYMIYQYFKKGGGDSMYYQYASIGIVFTLLPIFVTMYVQKKWQQEDKYQTEQVQRMVYNGLPAKRTLFKDYVSWV
jgi:hypothetical protein